MSLVSAHKIIDYKYLSRHGLGLVVLLEALVIIFLLSYIVSLGKNYRSLVARADQETEGINLDVATCYKLPYLERIMCAKTTGIKIASLFPERRDQIRECMKFRPFGVLIHFCFEGARSVLASPAPSPSPLPSP